MQFPDLHEHRCVVYKGQEELKHVLADYVRRSLDQDYVTVFVHHFSSDADALMFLESAGLDRASLSDGGLVLIRGRNAAFEDGGSIIDRGHVARLLEKVVEDSKLQGRAGVRVFADAAGAYIREGRESEWFSFEFWLGRRLQLAVGLVCAYPAELLVRREFRDSAHASHAGGVPAAAAEAESAS